MEGRRPREPKTEHTCDICGAPAVERHCRIICLRCGYTRDCADP